MVFGKLRTKTRTVKLGYAQRCAAHYASATDAAEAVACGEAAVRAAAEGKSGFMVKIIRSPGEDYCWTTGLQPLGDIANVEHLVPRDWISADGFMPNEKFIQLRAPVDRAAKSECRRRAACRSLPFCKSTSFRPFFRRAHNRGIRASIGLGKLLAGFLDRSFLTGEGRLDDRHFLLVHARGGGRFGRRLGFRGMIDGLDKSQPQLRQALFQKRVLLFIQVALGLNCEHLELVDEILSVLKILDGLPGLRVGRVAQKNQRHIGVLNNHAGEQSRGYLVLAGFAFSFISGIAHLILSFRC